LADRLAEIRARRAISQIRRDRASREVVPVLSYQWKDRLAGEHIRNQWPERYESYFVAGQVTSGPLSYAQPTTGRIYIFPHAPGVDVVVDRVGIRIKGDGQSKKVIVGFYSFTSFRKTADFYPEILAGQVKFTLGAAGVNSRIFWIDCWFPLFANFPYWVAVAMEGTGSAAVPWPANVGLTQPSTLTTPYGTSGADNDEKPTVALYKDNFVNQWLPPRLESGLLRLAPSTPVPAVYLRYALGLNPWGASNPPGGSESGGSGGVGPGGGE
jgi:hypothetical protein